MISTSQPLRIFPLSRRERAGVWGSPRRSFCSFSSPLPSGAGKGRKVAAFTLIETMLAVLVMALLGSAVALRFSRPLQSARAREAISQIHFADDQARQAATRFSAPVKLVLDPSANSIVRYEGGHLRSSVTLPPSILMQEVIVGRHASWEDRAEVSFSSSGLSRSYAVHLTAPAFDQWLLFAGLSGQMTWVSDEKTLRSMLDIAAPPGRDAD